MKWVITMTEPLAAAHHTTLPAPVSALAAPLLYLSSEAAGWEGLLAQAFCEPMELDGWMTTDQPDVSLILFAGGPLRLEQRQPRGQWRAQHFRSGDLLLRPGGGASYEVRWQSLTREPTQTLHLHLSQSLVARTAEEAGGCDSARLTVVGRSGFQDPLLAQIGFALWRELEQQAPAGRLYARTAAQMLAVHLLRHYTARGLALNEPSHGLTQQQMGRVIDYVEAHLGQELSLDALARQTSFSTYHFTRLFRQATGESPHRYVLRQRLERAQHLLKETGMPLAQIALETGFASQSHLTSVFKQQRGVTPRAYRQDR
jgi:AraC family transcriptional regulator